MKLILIVGTSLSAVGLAMGFAMFADQAMSRESDRIAAPRPILPARIAPDLTADFTNFARTGNVASAVAPKVAAAPSLETLPTAGNSVIARPQADRAAVLPVPALQPIHRDPLAEPPPRKPVMMAAAAPLAAQIAPATVSAPIPRENFENLPLIGVYR